MNNWFLINLHRWRINFRSIIINFFSNSDRSTVSMNRSHQSNFCNDSRNWLQADWLPIQIDWNWKGIDSIKNITTIFHAHGKISGIQNCHSLIGIFLFVKLKFLTAKNRKSKTWDFDFWRYKSFWCVFSPCLTKRNEWQLYRFLAFILFYILRQKYFRMINGRTCHTPVKFFVKLPSNSNLSPKLRKNNTLTLKSLAAVTWKKNQNQQDRPLGPIYIFMVLFTGLWSHS